MFRLFNVYPEFDPLWIEGRTGTPIAAVKERPRLGLFLLLPLLLVLLFHRHLLCFLLPFLLLLLLPSSCFSSSSSFFSSSFSDSFSSLYFFSSSSSSSSFAFASTYPSMLLRPTSYSLNSLKFSPQPHLIFPSSLSFWHLGSSPLSSLPLFSTTTTTSVSSFPSSPRQSGAGKTFTLSSYHRDNANKCISHPTNFLYAHSHRLSKSTFNLSHLFVLWSP